MVHIHPATAADLDLLVPLFDAYRVFYRKQSDHPAARTFLSERLALKDSVIYLAFINQQPAGFTQLYPLFSSVRMRKLWLLNDLFVHSDHRRKGVSIALIDQAKTLAIETNAAGLMLETEKSNAPGNRLYPQTGFDLNEESNFYFWENKP